MAFVPKLPSQARQYRLSILAMGRRAAKNAARKGKSDALKAKVNGRYGKLVLQAAKAGGGSPDSNKALAQVMEQARKAGVPKDIIERNLKRAEDKSVADLAEAIFEVYAPGGSGFVLECLTDNKQRAASEIWTVVKKLNGKMAEAGSVLFNFARRGEVCVEGVSEDEAFEAAMNAGADDVEPWVDEEGAPRGFRIVSSVESFGAVRDALYEQGVSIDGEGTGLAYEPLATVDVEDDEQFQANEDIYERCLELDDVDAIYTTAADVGRNARKLAVAA